MTTTYPDNYDDRDKAMYDTLMLQGQGFIGTKISRNDIFLLDLASRATINKLKGIRHEMSDEEIAELRASHKKAMETMIHETPEGLYEPGQHPLELNPSPEVSQAPELPVINEDIV
jgi:hypothetical protein